ncbi:sensor histidine kinase [Kordiimonas pumila]|uniref:histidine kinase n=1 Tax=Kordiimonas pumila TaxID=2161677 RepID=A0ABV7D7C3_9PROT|nr:hypothetical protein [Kordiimonas pumila]
MRFYSPTRVVQAAVLLSLATVGICYWLATSVQWMGLTLTPDAVIGQVVIIDTVSNSPAEDIDVPAILKAVNGFPLTATDIVEEPDLLNDNKTVRAFLERQTALWSHLQSKTVILTLGYGDEQERTVAIVPTSRPAASLPAVFWVQILVGAASFLISTWVWSLRQSDWGARCFALSGLSTLTFACAAAIYSTRELAFDGALFKLLSTLNYSGAVAFGIAIPAMFLVYPKQLVKVRYLLFVPVLFAPVVILDILQRYGLGWPLFSGLYLPPIVGAAEMFLIVALVVVQWFATRKDPHNRAVLRWLGLSVVVCAGAFISLAMLPLVIQESPQVSQGWMFVFFLLIYIGLALGLRRYRLFELDTWAFRIIFYMAALILFVVLDALIIYALDFGASFSTGLSVLLIGILYLPLRDILWRKMLGHRNVENHALFHQVIEIAFTSTQQERVKRWKTLLYAIFDPLEIRELSHDAGQVVVKRDGIELQLPALAGIAPLAMCYSHRGRALFSPADLNLAQQIITLMRHAEKSRDAYERGKTEERKRIAQDLHDDIGAGLLTSLHTENMQDIKSTIRKTLSDMRTVVSGLIGGTIPLYQLIAALRHESHIRLEAAGIELNWPLSASEEREDLLDYQVYKNYISIHREIISNIIVHSGAKAVDVTVEAVGNIIRICISDDGAGLMLETAVGKASSSGGNGIPNMRRRAEEIGGRLEFPVTEKGYAVQIEFSLAQMAV